MPQSLAASPCCPLLAHAPLTSSPDVYDQAAVHDRAAPQLLRRRHRVDRLLLAEVTDLGTGPRAGRAVQAARQERRGAGVRQDDPGNSQEQSGESEVTICHGIHSP